MRKLPILALLLAAVLSPAQTSKMPGSEDTPAIGAKTSAMKHLDGLLPLDWDAKNGKLYLEIPQLDSQGKSQDLLYMNTLTSGAGSMELGLDRGQIAEGVVVRFERSGNKILLVQPNLAFLSPSADKDQQLAVTQSFPESVLWGFTVAAESPEGAVLVDATDFFLHDGQGIAETLLANKQGSYHPDAGRSAIVMDDTKAFPKNTEVEAELTLVTDDPKDAALVRNVTPDPHAMTVRERASFIELPPPGFTPRRFNPRSGYFATGYRDYAAPLGQPLDQLFILRHRLIKKDPKCVTACEAVEPIKYYVDRGAPEPIRQALVDGASWWDQAFQAAGWAKGTFQVALLPPGADPMDIRYNIIQWVHRDTRGWSYGNAIADPRTGEIIKGNVTLGSLRGRQDYLIAEALLSPYTASFEAASAHGPNPMLEFVLARIRQLSAHETGHTLGLAHNFAASTVAPGNSVMDYPHPWVTVDASGHIDLSHAYSVGIGGWDKVAIDCGYRQFAPSTTPEAEQAALSKILADADRAGQLFISDDDARPSGAANPLANLWDNGNDPAAELERVLAVRAAALKNFGETAIKTGTPMAQLEQTLVPLYLFHRYQTEAAVKEIGGLNYHYNLRGDGQPNPSVVDPALQKRALDAVLKTLSPDTLTIPGSILRILPPVPPGYPRTPEYLPSHTGVTFDPVAAAESSADLTLAGLLDPARAARIIEYHMFVPGAPSFRVMLESISAAVAQRTEGGHTVSSEVERAVEFRALEGMFALALNPAASSQTRAIVRYHLADLLKQLTAAPRNPDLAEEIHHIALIDRINEFERDPGKFVPIKPVDAPSGMPIGDDQDF